MTSIPDKDVLYGAEIISDLLEGKLEHHGIKGMRWGVRRFQNKDGSLTPAGKKRYGSADAKVGSSPERSKPSLLRGKSGGAKKLSEMTDAELDAAIERMRKEQSYRELVSKMTPEKESRAQKLILQLLETLAKQSGEALIDRFVTTVIWDKNNKNNKNSNNNKNNNNNSNNNNKKG